MIPPPLALGLTLCDYVLIEEGTRRASLIGTRTRLIADYFPYVAPPFFAFAALSDGLGEATMRLEIKRPDTDEKVYAEERRVRFSDRLRELQVVFYLEDVLFPAPGSYECALLVDNEWVAQRRLRVLSVEKET